MKTFDRLLTLLFKENPQPMWIYDTADYQILACNDTAVALYGYSSEEFLQKNVWDLVFEEDHVTLANVHDQIISDRYYELKLKHVNKAGRIFEVKIYSRPVVFNERNCRLAIIQDIQEHLNVQTALTSTSLELKTILDTSLDFICAVDQQGIFVECNKASKSIFLYDPEELIGKPFTEFMVEEDLKPSTDIFEKIIQGESVLSFKNRFRKKDGSIVYLDWSVKWDECRQRTFSIARDITHQIEAEGERKNYTEKISNILESITDGFFAIDKNNIITYWNAAAECILQMPRKDVLNKNLWSVYADAVSLKFYQQYSKAMNEQVMVRFEEYFPRLNMWLDVTAYPGADGLSVYFRDITEAKNYQLALKESNERFELVSMATEDVVWEHNLITGNISWNRAIETLLGYTNEECIRHESFWLNNIHPDDLQRIKAGITQVIATGGRWQDTYRFKAADGMYKYFVDRGYVIKDAEGRAVKMIGTMQNITELKAREKELREHNKKLSEIAHINSHQLRRPLANILGLVEIAERTSPADLPTLLALIKESSRELDEVIKEIALKAYAETVDEMDS